MQGLSGVQNTNTTVYAGNVTPRESGTQNQAYLQSGETVSGKIVSLSDDGSGNRTAQIDLGGGTTISAKLQDGLGLTQGQTVTFEVKGDSNSAITLRPLFENTAMTSTAMKALMAAGLDANNTNNLTMIKSMMENGMSIDKNSILDMNQILNSNPGKSVSTLVEMHSLNLPIDENSIEQFVNYKNYEHQMVSDIDNIMEQLPEAYKELIANGDNKGAADLYGNVLKLFAGTTDAAGVNPNGQMTVDGQTMQTSNQATINNPNGTTTGEVTGTASEPGTGIEGAKPVVIAGADSLNTLAESEEVLVYTDGKNGTAGNKISGNPEDIVNQNKAESQAVTREQPAARMMADISLQEMNQSQNNIELSARFIRLLTRLGVSEETINGYMNNLTDRNGNPITSQDILKELANLFENSEAAKEGMSRGFGRLFASNEYNDLLKDAIANQWLLKPGEVEKENVESLYRKLNDQARQLTNIISESAGASSKVMGSVNNLQNNIDFMNQLNQMFAYVQLPLKMANQNAHGDLYVYRNKKQAGSDDGSVSAILHLDMDNLGPLDVYVKLKDNNVKTNFYVADESVIDLIEDNIDILSARLEKRGYQMSCKTMLHDDIGEDSEDIPIDEMFTTNKVPLLSMQSFDARA